MATALVNALSRYGVSQPPFGAPLVPLVPREEGPEARDSILLVQLSPPCCFCCAGFCFSFPGSAPDPVQRVSYVLLRTVCLAT